MGIYAKIDRLWFWDLAAMGIWLFPALFVDSAGGDAFFREGRKSKGRMGDFEIARG